MRRRWSTLLLGLSLALVAAGCAGSSSDGSKDEGQAPTSTASTTTQPTVEAEVFDGSVEDFYTVPDPLPEGPHGTLIRYQPMDDYQLGGTTTYRIMYLSESLAGDPIAVTGMAAVPTAAAPEDGRPMLTISHGTTGIADPCAPSKRPKSTEMTLAVGHIGEQTLIAATDYEGLGTPGRHPYLVGESEGRSSIDAILAAGSLPDADPGDELAIAGYSQGGHGALWTSQVAAEWAPDLEVVGVFAGAPASEIGVILSAAQRVKGFALMVIAGIHAAYPDAELSEMLTPQGEELLAAVDEGCAPQVFSQVSKIDGADLFVADGGQEGRWKELGAAQDAGAEKTNDAPTLIIHSSGDTTVPPFFIDQVVGRMCADGQVVERRDVDTGGHTETAIPSYEQASEWIQARFADDDPGADVAVPVVDSCDEAAGS